MGIVGSFAKRIWNGIKYAGEYALEGIRWVGRKVGEAAEAFGKLVKFYIGGLLVQATVGISLVAADIIYSVLDSFFLGLSVGILILFLGLYISYIIIFGNNNPQDNPQDNNEEDENENLDEQNNNYINVYIKDKPNFDQPIKKKEVDLTGVFLKNVKSYLQEIENNFFTDEKKCIYSFKYNNENNEIIDEIIEPQNVAEVKDNDMILSYVFYKKDENIENTIYLDFSNVFNGNDDMCKKILSKIVDNLRNTISNNYSLIISEIVGNTYENIQISELKDPSTLKIILQKNLQNY